MGWKKRTPKRHVMNINNKTAIPSIAVTSRYRCLSTEAGVFIPAELDGTIIIAVVFHPRVAPRHVFLL
eukprot:scaffold26554_cov81-Phaeocystis_antarctica.AAC.2